MIVMEHMLSGARGVRYGWLNTLKVVTATAQARKRNSNAVFYLELTT
jgi:hypothetical protein